MYKKPERLRRGKNLNEALDLRPHPEEVPSGPRGATNQSAFRTYLSMKWVVASGAILLVGAIGITALRLQQGPLPAKIVSSVSFPLYYPSQLPTGYSLKPGSANVVNGIVFYTLQNDTRSVRISEQALPSNAPNLAQFSGFNKVDSNAGTAVVGSALGKPVGLIESNTTLINIIGLSQTPSDVLVQLIKNMQSLPQP